MTLSEIVAGLPVERLAPPPADPADPVVAGVSFDSRRVAPGDLYVAWAGDRTDGRRFAAQAVARGAVAVLAHDAPLSPIEVPWLVARDPRRLLAPISARVYDHPDRELRLAAVTGTNGKTTTAILLCRLFEHAGYPCGLMGTLGARFGTLELAGDRTTPEGSDFYHSLRRMRAAGAAAVTLEASSHALRQGRLEGVGFELVLFTNLTRDHLDFHRDMEDYFEAKCLLFDQLEAGGTAVVNGDDEYGRRLAARLDRPLVYGEERGDVHVVSADLDTEGTRAVLATPRGRLEIETPLLGRFHLLNVLAAVAGAEGLGLDQWAIVDALAATRPIKGRMEPIVAGQAFPVMVDFAHTPVGLEAAVGSLRALWPRRIALVFGCGGDRDRGKRQLMGRAAGELADLAIVTDDNPRSEDPASIRAEVIEGVRRSGAKRWESIGERERAIRFALELAHGEPEWAVLIAGKGHESHQLVGDERRTFSDQEVARRILEDLLGTDRGQ